MKPFNVRFGTVGSVEVSLLSALLAFSSPAAADIDQARAIQAETQVLETYERVLPLEGGSNFRDLGGYETEDNRTVRHGMLYRSGVLTGLTEKDQKYLQQFGFETVVDLRSRDELELYPNHWAQDSGLTYLSHDYGITDFIDRNEPDDAASPDTSVFYRSMPYALKPQLRMYFDQLIEGKVPLVVNCSAGQDRTGVASALLLSALGVPRETVIEDYLLSTEYRRPQIERGSVDLKAAAKTNAFAELMLRYSKGETPTAKPLVTEDGTPYLHFALAQIEEDYGSIHAFLEQELEVSRADIARLKRQYLQ